MLSKLFAEARPNRPADQVTVQCTDLSGRRRGRVTPLPAAALRQRHCTIGVCDQCLGDNRDPCHLLLETVWGPFARPATPRPATKTAADRSRQCKEQCPDAAPPLNPCALARTEARVQSPVWRPRPRWRVWANGTVSTHRPSLACRSRAATTTDARCCRTPCRTGSAATRPWAWAPLPAAHRLGAQYVAAAVVGVLAAGRRAAEAAHSAAVPVTAETRRALSGDGHELGTSGAP